ncbi:MAG TPA: DUF3052 domain-containing protein [Kribbellaceae bacterium]|nr:DUF3052 domain-containing protein [Kribbellaceae bacterium]
MTADSADKSRDTSRDNPALRLGLEAGTVVQELGYDDDCDDAFRDAITDLTGEDFADENTEDVVDVVLLWWRDEDGDLVDALVDALTDLKAGGVVWLMTPKVGRDGYVDASEIAEAAPTAGLATTSSLSITEDWAATKLVMPKSPRSKR